MILVGGQRGGGADLARHLMKDENEHVVVHEIRGFVSNDLKGAFQESHAISRGTRCKQHLYSLSLNPPKEADPTPELLVDAVNRAEERLGLAGQPRAIVFHEKRGMDGQTRRHAHAVWCRIDTDRMRAVQMSYDRPRLQSLGRELYIEHGWTMPRGFVNSKETNPRNYSLAEWQQAKRAEEHPAELKGMFQDCWAISDSQTSFANSLKEHGYILARGDRRGVVAVDHKGEAYPIRQYVGISPKRVRERITDMDGLPDVPNAHHEAAKIVTDRLQELRAAQHRAGIENLRRLAGERRRKQIAQRDYARRMQDQQKTRWHKEERERQARIKTGWRGLIDWITGKRRRIETENRVAAKEARKRDSAERAALATLQRAAREDLLKRAKAEKDARKALLKELREDIRQIETPKPQPPGSIRDEDRTAYVNKQKREISKAKRRRTPTAERTNRRKSSRDRDGPSPGR